LGFVRGERAVLQHGALGYRQHRAKSMLQGSNWFGKMLHDSTHFQKGPPYEKPKSFPP